MSALHSILTVLGAAYLFAVGCFLLFLLVSLLLWAGEAFAAWLARRREKSDPRTTPGATPGAIQGDLAARQRRRDRATVEQLIDETNHERGRW